MRFKNFYPFPEGPHVLEDLLTTTSTFFKMFILDVQSPKGIIPVCCCNNANNHICPKVMEVVKIMVLKTCTNIDLLGSKKKFLYIFRATERATRVWCVINVHTLALCRQMRGESHKKA